MINPIGSYVGRDGRRLFCAWCRRDAGIDPSPGQSDGICPRHQAELLADVGLRLERDTNNLTRLASTSAVMPHTSGRGR